MKHSGYAVRRASDLDARGIIAMHRAAVVGSAAKFYTSEIIDEWSPPQASLERIRSLETNLATGKEVGLVAILPNGAIIGYGSIIPDESLLGAIYVDTAYSGQGVGRLLLENLERIAKERSISALKMDASLNAERFYRSHGYDVIGRGNHTLHSGGIMACVKMQKTL